MHTDLVILAAGASSRMKKSKAPQGLSQADSQRATQESKALITYGDENRPILDHLLLNAQKAGYTDVTLIVAPKAEGFKQYYGPLNQNNDFHGMRLSYATQFVPEGREKPLGTADAVYQTMLQHPRLKQTAFTVCNSDNLYSVDVLSALRTTAAPNALIAYNRDGLKFSMERISRFALLSLDEKDYLKDIIEKPDLAQTEAYRDGEGILRVSMNIFKFDGGQMFPYLEDCELHPMRDEKELPSAILALCQQAPQSFLGIPFNEHVPDLTTKEDIETFRSYLK